MSEMIKRIGDVGIFEIGPWSKLEARFAAVYKACFAEAPYFEDYDVDWVVENVYNQHIYDGCVAVALQNGALVGITCSKPMRTYKESSPYRYLAQRDELPFDLDNSLFGAQELSGIHCIAHETDEVPSESTGRIYLWQAI